MAKRLSASEETELLRQTIREAHEATQGLWDAIRAAQRLQPELTEKFERHANREIRDLANNLQEQFNRQSGEMNQAVSQAKELILQHLLASELALDKNTGTVRLLFPPLKFDDHYPIPYPDNPPKESHQ